MEKGVIERRRFWRRYSRRSQGGRTVQSERWRQQFIYRYIGNHERQNGISIDNYVDVRRNLTFKKFSPQHRISRKRGMWFQNVSGNLYYPQVQKATPLLSPCVLCPSLGMCLDKTSFVLSESISVLSGSDPQSFPPRTRVEASKTLWTLQRPGVKDIDIFVHQPE